MKKYIELLSDRNVHWSVKWLVLRLIALDDRKIVITYNDYK